MGIKKQNRLVEEIYWKTRPILYVYRKNNLVWSRLTLEEILSCYYGESWRDMYAWTDDTPWRDS